MPRRGASPRRRKAQAAPGRRPCSRSPSTTCIAAAACARSSAPRFAFRASRQRAPPLPAKRVSIVYDPGRAGEVDLIAALERAGFAAAPIEAAKKGRDDARQKYLLRRVAVAGFAAMNIMLISVAVWSGTASDMEPSARRRLPLALGADRLAHGRLCRAALLRFGARRAQGRGASTWTCRSRSPSCSRPP